VALPAKTIELRSTSNHWAITMRVASTMSSCSPALRPAASGNDSMVRRTASTTPGALGHPSAALFR